MIIRRTKNDAFDGPQVLKYERYTSCCCVVQTARETPAEEVDDVAVKLHQRIPQGNDQSSILSIFFSSSSSTHVFFIDI